MTDTVPTPAGWYPDPDGGPNVRWWDGVQWTDHHAPLQQRPEDLKAPAGTKTNTVWIWLIVFLPVLSYLSLFSIDWNAYFQASLASPTGSVAALFTPGYVLTTVLGWILFALLVVFGYLDYRALIRNGVPRPFHWGWSFLNPVYPIGRAVVVRRRTGSGIWPMWGAIGVLVFGFIVAIIFSVYLAQVMMSYVPIYSSIS
ncbi:MAG: DUF2510 domain-containing protein [Rhodoglobus sp.]